MTNDNSNHCYSSAQTAPSACSEYDNETFFAEYAKMPRSQDGLEAAGEWHQLEPLFPDMENKTVLDLGCGYGWHCKYAADHGATRVLGIDLSSKMIKTAKERNAAGRLNIAYAALTNTPIQKTPGIWLSPTLRFITSKIWMRYSPMCIAR